MGMENVGFFEIFIFLPDYTEPHSRRSYSSDICDGKLRRLIGGFLAVTYVIPPVGRASGPRLGRSASK